MQKPSRNPSDTYSVMAGLCVNMKLGSTYTPTRPNEKEVNPLAVPEEGAESIVTKEEHIRMRLAGGSALKPKREAMSPGRRHSISRPMQQA